MQIICRAFKDTKSFFGWNRKTITVPVFFVAGLWIIYQCQGWDVMTSQLWNTIAFALTPVGVFAVLLFLWNLIQSPNRIKLDIADKSIQDLGQKNVELQRLIQEYKQNEQSLVITLDTYTIGLSRNWDYPNEPERAVWLRLKVFVNTLNIPIDKLDLEIEGKTIPATNWDRKNVLIFNVDFEVTEWWRQDKHQVELIAHVGGKPPYSSGRETIDFNVEVFTTRQIH